MSQCPNPPIRASRCGSRTSTTRCPTRRSSSTPAASYRLVTGSSIRCVCLNHGCIPSKAYISATDLAHDAGQAAEMGILADPAIDIWAARELGA
ncbi:hypothetical protein C8039_06635 [Halogeometricum sp. wsp3]|nr:hypothetical protein C8039_06635 [Halogeometricum sp. wsp3]